MASAFQTGPDVQIVLSMTPREAEMILCLLAYVDGDVNTEANDVYGVLTNAGVRHQSLTSHVTGSHSITITDRKRS